MRRCLSRTMLPNLAPTVLTVVVLVTGSIGCGTTKTRVATEQLLMSAAVDEAVAGVDFRSLAGEKVYFDTQYIRNVKGFGFVNADYIVSSLRQQMIAADCRVQDEREDADYIIEARVGTLGTNGHELVYGVPASQSLATAASFVPNVPSLPLLPELSLAKKDAQLGAAKIAVFAYERDSKRPVWQSGLARAKSDAQDVWILGAGPFQRGSIYDGTQFAGRALRVPKLGDKPENRDDLPVAFQQQYHFPRRLVAPAMTRDDSVDVEVAGFETPVDEEPAQAEQVETENESQQPLPPVVDVVAPAAATPPPQKENKPTP